MNRIGIKRALVVSILGYILISWYLLKFVEPPVSAGLIIAIFTPFFAVFAGGVNKMVDILFENMEKNRRNRISLRCKLEEIIKYSFNHDVPSPLIDNSIKLINHPKYPPEIEQKIAEYNKKAEDLIDLFIGCGYFVKDMVIKNSLMYLHDIDVLFDKEKKVILWELGKSDRGQRLSELLAHVLKDRIIRGDEINKSVFENIDSTLYDKVVQNSSPQAFKSFLDHLNDDITLQRKYGCLKLLPLAHEEAKKLAEDLSSDAYVQG